MANPTTNPPAVPYLLTSDPFHAGLYAKSVFSQGSVYEVVSGRVGACSTSPEGITGTGHAPAMLANALLTGTGLKFGSCSPHVQFGSTQVAVPSQWAILSTFAINGVNPYIGNYSIVGNGSYGYADVAQNGLRYTILGTLVSGAINLNADFSGATTTPGTPIVLTVGHAYNVAICINDVPGTPVILFWLYDQTSQTLVANGVSVTSAFGGAPYAELGVLNLMATAGGYITIIDSMIWNGLLTNALFADYYADPWSTLRGPAPSSGTFTAGFAGLWDTTQTSVTVIASPPTGIGSGGSGAPTYQWYSSASGVDTAGSSTCPAISGATTLGVTVSGLSNTAVPRYYYLVATSGSSTVQYNAVYAQLAQGVDHPILCIGDSIMASGNWTDGAALNARGLGRYARYLNRSVGGTAVNSATASDSWQPPGTTAVGCTAGTLLVPAIAAGVLEGCTDALVALGANDTLATFQTGLPVLCAYLLANGISRIFLLPPTLRQTDPAVSAGATAAQNDNLRQMYAAELALAAANPATIFCLAPTMQAYTGNNPYVLEDGLHPIWRPSSYNPIAGAAVYVGIDAVLNPASGGGSGASSAAVLVSPAPTTSSFSIVGTIITQSFVSVLGKTVTFGTGSANPGYIGKVFAETVNAPVVTINVTPPMSSVPAAGDVPAFN